MTKNITITFLGIVVVALGAGYFLPCMRRCPVQGDGGNAAAIVDSLKQMESKLAKVESDLAKASRAFKPENRTADSNPDPKDVVEKARKADSDGDHAMAALYWQNALEHSGASSMLVVLKEYAESVFKYAKEDFSRYSDAVVLERMAAVAVVKVPANDIPAAKELHTRCAEFRDSLLAIADADAEESADAEQPAVNQAEDVANAVETILNEMRESIDKYKPGDGKKPTDAEYKILQLSSVAEGAMSQLWLLDRSGLSDKLRGKVDSFPARFAGAILDYNAKHDHPILVSIDVAGRSRPPKNRGVVAVHEYNIAFYTNEIAQIAEKAKSLRGIDAQEAAQKTIAALQTRVADERRKQMNEYQQFVANCCKLAFDSWDDVMNTGSAGFGRLPKNKGFKDENDFINRYVREFARKVTLTQLCSQQDRLLVYADDNMMAEALQRKSGGPTYWDVKNEHKAFIVTAIYGLYRIDQSLLTPETSRLFNDVWGKYYEKMDNTRKVWSIRWMVEEPKIRLEDF